MVSFSDWRAWHSARQTCLRLPESVTISPPLRSRGPSPLSSNLIPIPFSTTRTTHTPDDPVPLQPPVKYGTINCFPYATNLRMYCW